MLGAAELAAGGFLLARPLLAWAYLAPVVLLLLFGFLLARAVSRHESFGCACFGADANEPISVATVLRTAGLLALAAGCLASALLSTEDSLPAGGQLLGLALGAAVLASFHLTAVMHLTRPFAD